MTSQKYKLILIASTTGVVLFLFTFLLNCIIKRRISDELSQRLPLVSGSDSFEKWSSPSVPVHLKFHFFNVSNPDEILEGKKAKVSEIGPFTYQEIIERDILGWSENEEHLRFRTKKSYKFLPEKSVHLDTSLTTINLPLVALISITLQKSNNLIFSPIIHSVIHGAVKKFNESLFVTRTAREMIFEGYQVPLIKSFIDMAEKFGFDIPNAPEDGRFGLMIGKNGSDDGEWMINTGKYDLSNLAMIKTWNNKTKYTCWGSSGDCNRIRGTEGSLFPPPITQSSKPDIYCPDLNRTITSIYKMELTEDGVTRYRFVVPKSSFAAPLSDTENECYCTKKEGSGQRERFCSLDGVLDLGGCNQGIPAVISCPHFFLGDKLLTAPFESGMDPEESKHESFFDLEPNSGAVLSAAKRLQLNVDLKYINLIPPFKSVREIIFPSNWVEESFQVTDHSTLSSIEMLQNVTNYVALFVNVSFGISVFLIIISVASYTCIITQNFPYKHNIFSSSTMTSSGSGSYMEVESKEVHEDDVKITCEGEEKESLNSDYSSKVGTPDESRNF